MCGRVRARIIARFASRRDVISAPNALAPLRARARVPVPFPCSWCAQCLLGARCNVVPVLHSLAAAQRNLCVKSIAYKRVNTPGRNFNFARPSLETLAESRRSLGGTPPHAVAPLARVRGAPLPLSLLPVPSSSYIISW